MSNAPSQPAWARPKKQPRSVRNKRNNNTSKAPPQQQQQQQQQQPVYYCSVLLPESSSRARLLSSQDKWNKIQLADKAAKMEAYLKLPRSQSREIFALSDRPKIPFVKLPRQPQAPATEDNTNMDSDDTDVEELFLELAHELDSTDKAIQRRLANATKNKLTSNTTFAAAPTDYFSSPGLIPSKPGAKKEDIDQHEPPPSINVRITGTDIIQDVFLSPIVERPPPVQQQQQQNGKDDNSENGRNKEEDEQNKTKKENDEEQQQQQEQNIQQNPEESQTRPDEMPLGAPPPPFSLRPPPHLSRSRRTSRTTQQMREQVVPETQSQASSRHSSSSAVSPRFMALRKLSQGGPDEDEPEEDENSGDVKVTTENIISQAVRRTAEAQRALMEEHKREIIEYLDKLKPSNQLEELETLRKQTVELEAQVNSYRINTIKLQRQLFEMELLKTHNAELEKQCDLLRRRNTELEEQAEQSQDQHVGRIRELEAQVAHLTQVLSMMEDAEKQNLAAAAARRRGSVVDWAEEQGWAEKYRELQARYSRLEKELEKKEQQQQRRRTSSPKRSYFMNEQGHLTFTTEINGQLSQYTVKIPTTGGASGSKSDGNRTPSPPAHRAPARRRPLSSNNITNITSSNSKLNPMAQPWKLPSS